MAINRKLKSYMIGCPSCKKERFVTYPQWWNINVGNSTGKCLSCAEHNIKGLEKGRAWNKGLIGFNKGHPAYSNGLQFKGKKHTPESLKKMSLAKLGIKKHPLSEEVKRKISLANLGKVALKGSSHPNWKGGITSKNKLLRQKFRETIFKQVLKRDNYTCKICLNYGGNLQVDHIQNWADFPKLRFNINNCRTLCMACHYKITFNREKPSNVIWGHNLKHVYVKEALFHTF